jgi:hypothetical protein
MVAVKGVTDCMHVVYYSDYSYYSYYVYSYYFYFYSTRWELQSPSGSRWPSQLKISIHSGIIVQASGHTHIVRQHKWKVADWA